PRHRAPDDAIHPRRPAAGERPAHRRKAGDDPPYAGRRGNAVLEGTLYWNDAPIADSGGDGKEAIAALETRLAETVKTRRAPEVQIRADRDIRYQRVAGFITTPGE
ncbi:MAG: hypothetical protein LBP86_03030, partial [Azoarcus sp.]|nr:hypothetical protein [Azoarcus sp.]